MSDFSPILAQNPSGVPSPCQVDGSGNLKTTAVIASSATNPLTTSPQISELTKNGQSFTALFNLNAAAGIYPLSLWNPSSAKNALIYSIKINTGTGGATCFLRIDTSNPAFATVITPNNRRAGGAASVMTSTATSTTQSSPTNLLEQYNSGNLVHTFDFMNNGQVYLLPASANSGLTAFIQTFASGLSSLVITWLEY